MKLLQNSSLAMVVWVGALIVLAFAVLVLAVSVGTLVSLQDLKWRC
jgi:hypothetical protein